MTAKIDAAELSKPVSEAKPVDVVAGVARIEIKGVLMPHRSRWLDIFGIPHTSYLDIAAQVREAEADRKVKAIELQVDSGGGTAGNMIVDTAEIIAATTKPTTAMVGEMAASAAYWLAAQADKIVLAGPATMVGSIGVAQRFFVDDEVVEVTSTDAPEKRPDVRTEAGRAMVRKELDPIHELFVDAVARGRDVSADTVNNDFGQGGVLLGAKAVAAGMADEVISTGPPPARRASVDAMLTLAALKKEHPEAHAAAVKEELDRVCAHLDMAEKSGAHKESAKHIRDGRDIDNIVIAAHAGAQMETAAAEQRKAAEAEDISTEQHSSGSGGGTSEFSQSDLNILATYKKAGLK